MGGMGRHPRRLGIHLESHCVSLKEYVRLRDYLLWVSRKDSDTSHPSHDHVKEGLYHRRLDCLQTGVGRAPHNDRHVGHHLDRHTIHGAEEIRGAAQGMAASLHSEKVVLDDTGCRLEDSWCVEMERDVEGARREN